VSLPPTAEADTDASPVLRYAATPTTDLAKSLVVTVTLAPASAEVAVFVQARPRMPLPSRDCSSVHPVTELLTVLVVELVVRYSTNASPACTAAGTCTVWLDLFPAVLAAPTKEISPGTACAAGAVAVTATAGNSTLTTAMNTDRMRLRP
jgi:hypothetical protein